MREEIAMEVSRESMLKAERTANAKALKQGTVLAWLRNSQKTSVVPPKGLRKSSRKEITVTSRRQIMRRLQATAKKSQGLTLNEIILRQDVQMTYSPEIHLQKHNLFLWETRLTADIIIKTFLFKMFQIARHQPIPLP